MAPPRLAVPHDAAPVRRALRCWPQKAACALCKSLSEQRLDKAGQPSLSCAKAAGGGGADWAVDDGREAEDGEDLEPAELSVHLERFMGLLAARPDQVQLQDFSQQELMEPLPPSAGPDPSSAPD